MDLYFYLSPNPQFTQKQERSASLAGQPLQEGHRGGEGGGDLAQGSFVRRDGFRRAAGAGSPKGLSTSQKLLFLRSGYTHQKTAQGQGNKWHHQVSIRRRATATTGTCPWKENSGKNSYSIGQEDSGQDFAALSGLGSRREWGTVTQHTKVSPTVLVVSGSSPRFVTTQHMTSKFSEHHE